MYKDNPELYNTNLYQSTFKEFIRSNYKDTECFNIFEKMSDSNFIEQYGHILNYDYKAVKALLKILEQEGKVKLFQSFSLNKNAAIVL